MTTEKALREALTRIKMFAVAGRESAHGQCKNLVGDFWAIADQAEAALSLPETQGEPVAGDVEWLHKFINCTPFGADAPAEDMQRAHRIVDSLYAAPPSQPAQGEPVAWVECDGELVWQNKAAAIGRNLYTRQSVPAGMKLVPVEPTPEMLTAGYPSASEEAQSWGIAEVYRAMLAAAPAAPPVPKTPAQEGERKWRAFTWPNGEGEPPLVCLRHGMADITPPCRKWCGSASCTPPTQAKPTNGEGA